MFKDLSLFGLIEQFQNKMEEMKDTEGMEDTEYYTRNRSGSRSSPPTTKVKGGVVATIVFFLFLFFALALYIWAIVVLVTFKIDTPILILSFVLLFGSGPIIPIILAYSFKGSALKGTNAF